MEMLTHVVMLSYVIRQMIGVDPEKLLFTCVGSKLIVCRGVLR